MKNNKLNRKGEPTYLINPKEVQDAEGKFNRGEIYILKIIVGLHKVETKNGMLVINKNLQTSRKHIFAAGDCISPFKFTHIAGYQGFIAARNALLPLNRRGMPDYVTWTTFTEPEVAFVGKTSLINEIWNGEYKEEIFFDKIVDRAVTDSAKEGYAKTYSNAKGKIVGVSIVSPRAGELIHEWLIVMQSGLKMSKIATAVHAYPTYSMSTMQLAGDVYEKSIYKNG